MAKEGIWFVMIPVVMGVVILLLQVPVVSPVLSVIFFILSGYFGFFFRNPDRVIDAGPGDIVSPADGTVLDVISEGRSHRLVIFLSIFNVHITRMPFTGRVENMNYFHGSFLPAYREKSSELNERITLEVTSSSFQYRLRLIAGIAARRIKMWIKEGDTMSTGNRIGIIMFGSRAELILPEQVDILVKKGDKVYGGTTLIGKIKSQK